MNILLQNGPIRLGYTHLSLENLKSLNSPVAVPLCRHKFAKYLADL
jgi:hypothetical protein